MKRFVLIMLSIFTCAIATAATETINWYVDGNTYATNTCQTGGDIVLPTPPTKYGYTFQGWDAYVPIEYLESTGTQWINTGVIAYDYTTWRVKINMSATTGSGIVGTNTSNSDSALIAFFNYNQSIYFDVGTDRIRIVGAAESFKNNTTYDFLCGIQYVKNYATNSLLVGTPRIINNYNPLHPLNLLAGGGKGKVYLLQIWDNDVLIRDFIPVLDENNVPCMYDKVENKFYYNQGTGQFIAGPIINQ